MKKITLLVAALAFVVFNVQAQDEALVSKKGFTILPEQGDFAIGVDVAPFFSSLNFMSTGTTGPKMSFGDGLSVIGKYYASADMAYRVKFAANMSSTTQNTFVTDQTVLNPTAADVVEDKTTANLSHYALSVGFEKRRGSGRLQGYYGADFFTEYKNGSSSSTYGNALDAGHTGIRTVDTDNGAALSFGLRGFVGVEYFIAPKISLGGELGWGVAYQMGFDGSATTEEWDAHANDVKSETVKNGGADDQFLLGSTGATQGFFETSGWLGLGGNVNIIFHF